MLYSLSVAAALPLLAHAAADILDDNRMVQAAGILRYPIRVSSGAPPRILNKRLVDAGLTSQWSGNFYTIDIELGTPARTVGVNFDTGSSELWVNPVCSNSSSPDMCPTFGHFDSNASSTFNATGQSGSITYGSGFAQFKYASESIGIGSAKLSKQLFGVANSTIGPVTGILGAAPWVTGWDSPYPVVIDSLAKQGFTNSRAFSVDLRPIGSSRGSVVFGGIDTKKFSGHLEKLAVIPAEKSPDNATRFWISLDGLAVTTENGDSITVFDTAGLQPVLLDSGSTFCSLPTNMFKKLLEGFPSAQQRGPNVWSVDCPKPGSNVTVDFKFGNLVINVPLADFVWQPNKTEDACALGATPNDQMPVLGDSFLRAAYAVFDWDNRNVHLAKTEDCGSNLVPIGRGPDAVPSVTGDCGQPTTTALPTTATLQTTTTLPNTTAFPNTTTLMTSTSGWYNSSSPASSSASAATTFTSTVTTSKVYTITSCPPTITNCTVGAVTTEVITSLTTYCPGAEATVTPSSSTGSDTEPDCTTPADSNVVPTVPTGTFILGSATGGAPGPMGSNHQNTATDLPAVTAGAAEWRIPVISSLSIFAFAFAIY